MRDTSDMPRDAHRAPRRLLTWVTTGLAMVAAVGVLYFFAAVAMGEALRPMYDPVQRTISELAVGRHGYLQVSAFVVLGLSLLALPAGLWQCVGRTALSRLGLVLLAAGGLASLIDAAFRTDLKGAAVTAAGQIHAVTAGVGYACLITAMLLLSLHFRRDHHWRSFHPLSSGLTVAGIVALLAMAVGGDGDFAGLLQRLMAAPLLTWVLFTGMRAFSLVPVGDRVARRPQAGPTE